MQLVIRQTNGSQTRSRTPLRSAGAHRIGGIACGHAAALGAVAALMLGLAAAAPAAERPAFGQTEIDLSSLPPIGEEYPGETVPPEAIGEGYIEGPEEVMARERMLARWPRSKSGGPLGVGGVWQVPSRGATFYPHSGKHYAMNKWGDTKMGIGFPTVVDVRGTWIAGQAAEGVWAEAVRVIGYLKGKEVGRTNWFTDIDDTPTWFEIGLKSVDRIVFDAKPAYNGAGWFAIDDFTYSIADDVGDREAMAVIIDFDDVGYRKKLTNSGYAGLEWESGTGKPATISPMPPPGTPPGIEGDAVGDGEDPFEPPAAPKGEGTLPEVVFKFFGVKMGDESSWSIPPDTMGAVGPNHFVEVVNNNFRVYNKENGQIVQKMSLYAFLPGSQGDPRVLFDQHSDRWIVIVSDYSLRIYLAISLTNNPAGSWYKTSFIAAQGSDAGTFPDYPTLGVDVNGIYTSAFMAGSSTMTMWAIDKAPLLESPPSLGTITAWRKLQWAGAYQPCHTYGNPGKQYYVSRPATSVLQVRQVKPPLTSPSMSLIGQVAIPSASDPPDAPAKGSYTPLDTVGSRLMNAVYRDGYIWTSHCINYAGRAAVRWYKIDTTNWQDEYGTVADSSWYFFFPSIMVNKQGNVLMGFTGSRSTSYASCFYTGRTAADTPGQMADPEIFKVGTAPYNNLDSYGRNRWGDYSYCTLDPNDELTLWSIQEFGYLTNIWGTYIGKFEFDPYEAPINNDCEDAIEITDGSYDFTNLGATTDGPDEVEDCDFYGYTHIQADVWFLYTASCDGPVTVDICDSDYNTKMAVYTAGCPGIPGKTIACDDRSCDGLQSFITFDASKGSQYRIRIGGYEGEKGSGTLLIFCGSGCPEDVNGDGVIDVLDLIEVLSQWGGSGSADINGDGVVDVLDLLAVLGAWGPC